MTLYVADDDVMSTVDPEIILVRPVLSDADDVPAIEAAEPRDEVPTEVADAIRAQVADAYAHKGEPARPELDEN